MFVSRAPIGPARGAHSAPHTRNWIGERPREGGGEEERKGVKAGGKRKGKYEKEGNGKRNPNVEIRRTEMGSEWKK